VQANRFPAFCSVLAPHAQVVPPNPLHRLKKNGKWWLTLDEAKEYLDGVVIRDRR